MESAESPSPVVKPVPTPDFAVGVPEVSGLHYESGRLVVSLLFEAEREAIAEFPLVRGFRVLDEGDLLEFWDPDTRDEGWLWTVEGGGWLAQEALRPGFVSGAGEPTYSEYLVLGQNDCVSVFSDDLPKVYSSEGE